MEGIDDLLASLYQHFNEDTVLDLARKLIAVPSHAASGEEKTAAVLARFLERAGLIPQFQRVEDVGVNLIATLPGEGQETALILNGHLDTVPPSSSMAYPPFQAVVRDGLLWGRGSCDMKGGLAAMACAMAMIRAANLPLKRSVIFTAVASEEQGNRGTAALIRKGLRAEWAVVGEPTGLDLVIAHKGVDRYRFQIEGRAAHESLPERGTNAIVAAAHLIAALDRNLFSKVMREKHSLLGPATYNIGTIQGGVSRNTVPDRCTFQVSKRWLPGDSPAAIRRELEKAIREVETEAKVSFVREPDMERVPHPPLELGPDHPLTRTLAMVIHRVIGRMPVFSAMPAFTDAALFQDAAIPAVVFGPGDLGLAHSDGESIPISQLGQATRVYAALAVIAANSL
ncbi:MAG TPA: M20 family metallopeptidase [Thermodesulfobacteriota bacterium]|nr:M20 family metallopeptidase [Thermodesulfobacteriota bacterium]